MNKTKTALYYRPNSATVDDELFDDLAKKHPGRGRPSDVGMLVPDIAYLKIEDCDEEPPGRRPGLSELAPRPAIKVDGGPQFSIDAFADGIRLRLNNRSTGWAFVINQNGQEAISDAGGNATVAGDLDGAGTILSARAFTPDTRVNVASVSKTITAVAVLRLLRATGKSVTSKIWPYLPAGWPVEASGVADLEFRHLLTHRTGLTTQNAAFSQTLSDAGLQTALLLGADPGAPYAYRNANFALFRLIIPALWREAGNTGAHNNTDVGAAFFYAAYIIDQLFGEMGGAIGENASTSVLDDPPTRYYAAAGTAQGIEYPNWALLAGAAGWHLSARELAAFLAFITYDDDVLDAASRAQMDSLRLGWQPTGTYDGRFGDYRGHSGSIRSTVNGVTGNARAGIMKFGIQVEAAFVANSAILGVNAPVADLLADAFDAAWG